jgi:hypothetical protein
MKTGQTLQEMAATLQRQMETKRDFIAPERSLRLAVMERPQPRIEIVVGNTGQFAVQPYAHQQLANHLGIPKPYYDKMLTQAPHLLVNNANYWTSVSPLKRMVRTLDGGMRAYLSERYRPLDNYDLVEAVLPTLMEDTRVQVESCQVTDTKLYLKATTPRLTAEITKGDVVQAGIVISNSEVGAGSVRVEPLLYRLVCLNGAIINDLAMKRYHIGGRANGNNGDDDAIQAFLRDETRAANDKAFWMTVQDVVRGVFEETRFQQIVGRFQEAASVKIDADPVKVVEVTAKRFGLTDSERGSVLQHLVEGGDLSKYGLCQAVTRASQDVEDYERATDLERAGGEIIELSRDAWRELTTV